MANWQELPNGIYRARAREGALSQTRDEKPMVVVTFDLLADEWKGVSMTWKGYFHGKTEATTQKAIDRTMESLRHCGWRGDDLRDLSGITDNEVDLDIQREEYQGKWSPKARWVNKKGAAAVGAPLASDKAAAVSAALRRAAEASRAKSARSSSAGIGGVSFPS